MLVSYPDVLSSGGGIRSVSCVAGPGLVSVWGYPDRLCASG